MRIAIIGAGNVGKALGTGWGRAGHSITFGLSRVSDLRVHEIAEAVPGARVRTNAEAVRDAEVVTLAVPWGAVHAALAECGDFGGRILIDATNPLGMGEEGLELTIGHNDSGGEEVARLAPSARVAKTMNQVGFAVMPDTSGFPLRPAMFVASDDDEAKSVALRLVGDLGFDGFDAGALRNARLLEPLAMLWIDQAMNRGAAMTNAIAFMRKGASS